MKPITHDHIKQYVRVSDKCYSMLLRRQTDSEESLSHVIKRLVDADLYSPTVVYQNQELNRRIYVNLELKKKLYEIKKERGVGKYDEVVWRLVVNGSKR